MNILPAQRSRQGRNSTAQRAAGVHFLCANTPVPKLGIPKLYVRSSQILLFYFDTVRKRWLSERYPLINCPADKFTAPEIG